MILLRYHHHDDGWWILAIPIVIVLWYLLKFLFALIVGGTVAVVENLDKILGGFGKVILGLFVGAFAIVLYILRILCSLICLLALMGACMGALYLMGIKSPIGQKVLGCSSEWGLDYGLIANWPNRLIMC